jgi:hypothetical protein
MANNFFQSQMFLLLNIKFNITKFLTLPAHLVWISEQTAMISLHNINWLVFITETGCVYCAVRTGALNKSDYSE